jgi:hypothetical protein
MGLFANDYPYDSAWHPYLTDDASILKSKVTAFDRGEASKHYNYVYNGAQKHMYAVAFLEVLLIVSIFGQLNRSKNKGAAVMSLLSNVFGVGCHVMITLPAMLALGKKHRPSPIQEAGFLRNVALGHVFSFISCAIAVTMQMGTLKEVEEESEFATKIPAKILDKKKVK